MKRSLTSLLSTLLVVLLATLGFRVQPALATGVTLQSPNGKLQLVVHASQKSMGEPSFSLYYLSGTQKVCMLDHAPLGIATSQQSFKQVCLRHNGRAKHVTVRYDMLTGKRRQCHNEGRQQTFTFSNAQRQSLGITFRVYDDGIAFRYELKHQGREAEFVQQEWTAYPIADGTRRWIQSYQPDSYEGFYPLTLCGTDGQGRHPHQWAYPALVQCADSAFMLITEADVLAGHCATYLNNQEQSTSYRVQLADDQQSVRGAWTSPWRVLVVGDLPTLVSSTLVTDVASPSPYKTTDWIHPGSVSWIYWAFNHGSRNYKLVCDYIDLAAEMHWPYSLIDAEWDEMGEGGTIEDALAYARTKQVKPMLWYNSSTAWVNNGAPGPFYKLNTPEDREKEFSWLERQGVAGVKIDFFKGDQTDIMNYCIDLLKDAAKHHLLVTFHGATIPRGWQRTYPNLMTVEGVYGAEWYNNNATLTSKAACHNTTIPFTRNIVGPMDYTPGTFTDSQHPHITTHAHELALPVVFESSLLHNPDRPSSYRALPASVKQFFTALPTVWDDTRLLSGYPGESIILARRSGDVWYVGALNGADESRTLSFSLADLMPQAKQVTLYTDGPDGRSFEVKELTLPEHITVNCLPRGGFVAVVR